MIENTLYDKKSLRLVQGKTSNISELTKDCVAFANAMGGHIHIGIEDDADVPCENQKVPDELLVRVEKRIKESTQNVFVRAEKKTSPNGGEYIDLSVYPSSNSIASTSDGKYFLRIGDASSPLLPDDLLRLLNDKPAFVWETKGTKFSIEQADIIKKENFINDVKASVRVSEFTKQKTDRELFEMYQMCDENGLMTNLGVLWVGTAMQRARISYSPVIQVIKYDSYGNKINKLMLDDNSLNPKEMLEYLMQNVSDWKDSYEVSDGLFRKQIPAYDMAVVRELIVNALVHRPYTTRGDVFINLTPEGMSIRNPGLLPLGVTPENILVKSVARNRHLAKIFYDLNLMEKEGSGYDLMFEKMMSSGKPLPIVTEDDDSVCVEIKRRYVNADIVQFMDKIATFYNLTQKETICIGIIVQNESISALDLSKKLGIKNDSDMRSWTSGLLKQNLITLSGKTKGSVYAITKETFSNVKYQTQTSLKTIENYRLKELIYQDLKRYRSATLAEIHSRIGKEIAEKQIRQQLIILINEGAIKKDGDRRWTKYVFMR